jgi:hypothetical protein
MICTALSNYLQRTMGTLLLAAGAKRLTTKAKSKSTWIVTATTTVIVRLVNIVSAVLTLNQISVNLVSLLLNQLTVNHGNYDTGQALNAVSTTTVLVYIRQPTLLIENLIRRIKFLFKSLLKQVINLL